MFRLPVMDKLKSLPSGKRRLDWLLVIFIIVATASYARYAYTKWMALHDELWTEIERGEKFLNKHQYPNAELAFKTAFLQAEKFEKERIAIRFLPRIRDTVLYVLYDQNQVYEAERNYPQQEAVSKLILMRSKMLYGIGSRQMDSSVINLLKVYRAEGKYSEAANLFKEYVRTEPKAIVVPNQLEHGALVDWYIFIIQQDMDKKKR